MHLINRAGPKSVALETTRLAHGVPRGQGERLARELTEIVRSGGAEPAFVGVVSGRPTVGMDWNELAGMLGSEGVEKTNTANLGLAIHRGVHAATTVSATMELAAAAGVRVFATGGIGGMHRGARWDVSADVAALGRWPVAVVCSGCKSLLDVESTREMLETLGVPVVGFGTDLFPAFYLRESAAGVDARFDDVGELAAFVVGELARTGRGLVVANPVPQAGEIRRADWDRWLNLAMQRAGVASGRDATPAILAALHEVSAGATLRANLALVRENARLAARIAAAI